MSTSDPFDIAAIASALVSDTSLDDTPTDVFTDPTTVEPLPPFADRSQRATAPNSHSVIDAPEHAIPLHQDDQTMSKSTDFIDGILNDGGHTLSADMLAPDTPAPTAGETPEPPDSRVAPQPAIDTTPATNHDDDTDEYSYDPTHPYGVDDDIDTVGSPTHSLWKRHRTRLIAGIGAGVVVLAVTVIAVLAMSGGDVDPQPGTSIITHAPPAATAAAGQTAPSATAGADAPVKIAHATSRCPAGSTDPMNAFDNQLSTAWTCVRSLGIDGQVLRVDLGGTYVVSSIGIIPGFNATASDGSDQWTRHRVVTRVKYTFNDAAATSFTQATNGLRDQVNTTIAPPVLASKVVITILGTAAPTGNSDDNSSTGGATNNPQSGSSNDFAVSTITVVGHRPN